MIRVIIELNKNYDKVLTFTAVGDDKEKNICVGYGGGDLSKGTYFIVDENGKITQK